MSGAGDRAMTGFPYPVGSRVAGANSVGDPLHLAPDRVGH
jgi:hypothetical protein